MDNVIQNVNINDITPTENSINEIELNELVNSIKKFGIIEPLLIRPSNGKYEIVLGNKVYHAAKKAGINILPAIIKEIDDNIIAEYKAISNMSQEKDTNSINAIQSQEKDFNSDIVNLSDLNKEEYEREDVKMNNELNNNVMNNNMGVNVANQGAEPTFGGKFFPSLEDEPTNMNMGGMNTSMEPTPVNNQPQQNLIDLTDSNDATPAPQMDNLTSPVTPEVAVPNMGMAPTPQMDGLNPEPIQNQPMMNNNMEMPNLNPSMNNTINIENLSSGYDPAPQMDVNNQNMMPEQNVDPTPQFDMSQTIDPNPMMSPDIGLGINGNAVDPNPNMSQQQFNPAQDMNMNQGDFNNPMMQNNNVMDSSINNMVQPIDQNIPTPDMNVPPVPQMDTTSQEMQGNEEYVEQGENEEYEVDVTPVINTVKAVAENMGLLGYGITISEEDLGNSYTITLEIEK